MIAIVVAGRGAAGARPQGVFAAGTLPRASPRGRGGADPARRLRAARSATARRLASGFVLDFRAEPGGARLRQRRRAAALRPGRRRDARPHDPHQELPADRAAAGGRPARRFRRARCAQRGRALRRRLPRLFRPPQRARGGQKRELDPMPRVILVPGLGLFGLGRSAKDARDRRRSRRIHDRDHRPTPRRSAASSRSARPTCSTSNTGRWSRPSSASAARSRWPARSRSSPAAPARSALPRRGRCAAQAPRSRCSTSTPAAAPRRRQEARRRRRSRSNAT